LILLLGHDAKLSDMLRMALTKPIQLINIDSYDIKHISKHGRN